MTILMAMFLTWVLVSVGYKWIKKYPICCYSIAAWVSAVIGIGSLTGYLNGLPDWLIRWGIPLFTKGSLGTAFFIVVMYTGALKNGSFLIKRLMPIRTQLSIIASILILSHNVIWGSEYLQRLLSAPETISLNLIWAMVISLMLLLMMLPLMFTSFSIIRKKMKPRSWKKLQKTAYLFYLLIYVHVLVIMLPVAKAGYQEAQWTIGIYSIIFLTYAALRIHKVGVKRDISGWKSYLPALAACSLFVVILGYMHGPANYSQKVADEVVAVVPSENVKEEVITIPKEVVWPLDDKVTESEPVDSEALELEVTTEEIKEVVDLKGEKQTVESGVEVKAPESVTEPVVIEPEVVEIPVVEEEEIKSEVEASVTESVQVTEPQEHVKFIDGIYTGSGLGYRAHIKVQVTIEGGKIQDIQVMESSENVVYMYDALKIVDRIIEVQDTDVDTISAATYSSLGILDAVKDALQGAYR